MSVSPSLSTVLGLASREWWIGSFDVSGRPLFNDLVSKEEFGSEGSSDVVSEPEDCEQDDERICDVVSLAIGSKVLIFESGASRALSLFACLVPL